MMEVVVIGGSAAGLKAACRVARLRPDARVRLVVQSPHFAYSACGLPYLLSGDIDDFTALRTTADGTIKDQRYFADIKRVEVLARCRADKIDRDRRVIYCLDLADGKPRTLRYDKLVIATGSEPIPLRTPGDDLPGVIAFTSPDDIIAVRRDLEAGKIGRVGIIGGGVIGLELCEAFRSLWGVEVELIELSRRVLAALVDESISRLIEAELEAHGVNIRLSRRCNEIRAADGGLELIDDSGGFVIVDRVINATGARSNARLAGEAGLELGLFGGMVVDDHLRSSDPDIYGAGDCVELSSAVSGQSRSWSLGSLANRMGRVAGDNVAGRDSKFDPVTGVTVLKVFDLTVGSAGLTAAECSRHDWDIDCSWGTFYDRMHYYPEAKANCFKLVCDRTNGRILGIQAAGKGELISFLNLGSQAIHAGAKRSDLFDLEPAYSPPYSQTIDPLAHLAAMIENCRNAGIKMIPPADLTALPAETTLLDVRTEAESAAHPLSTKGTLMAIPLGLLRIRLAEIPNDKLAVAVCQMGSRSYEAALMLKQGGFPDVGFLAGGMLFQPNQGVD